MQPGSSGLPPLQSGPAGGPDRTHSCRPTLAPCSPHPLDAPDTVPCCRYGCSSGTPTVSQTLADIGAVAAFLQGQLGKRLEDTVLYGQSGEPTTLACSLLSFIKTSSVGGARHLVHGKPLTDGFWCAAGWQCVTAAKWSKHAAFHAPVLEARKVKVANHPPTFFCVCAVGSGPTCHLAAQLPTLAGVVLHAPFCSGCCWRAAWLVRLPLLCGPWDQPSRRACSGCCCGDAACAGASFVLPIPFC
jgi:hypothetical protein